MRQVQQKAVTGGYSEPRVSWVELARRWPAKLKLLKLISLRRFLQKNGKSKFGDTSLPKTWKDISYI